LRRIGRFHDEIWLQPASMKGFVATTERIGVRLCKGLRNRGGRAILALIRVAFLLAASKAAQAAAEKQRRLLRRRLRGKTPQSAISELAREGSV
jgi:hypothetical protein